MKQIVDIKHIVVDTETDALLLENNLIKKHEDTIAHRETMFKDYLKVVGFNTITHL